MVCDLCHFELLCTFDRPKKAADVPGRREAALSPTLPPGEGVDRPQGPGRSASQQAWHSTSWQSSMQPGASVRPVGASQRGHTRRSRGPSGRRKNPLNHVSGGGALAGWGCAEEGWGRASTQWKPKRGWRAHPCPCVVVTVIHQ